MCAKTVLEKMNSELGRKQIISGERPRSYYNALPNLIEIDIVMASVNYEMEQAL